MVSRQSQAVVSQAHAAQSAKPSRSAPAHRSASNPKMGNQAAQRLLRDGVIQAKLTVSQPGDRFEQEADRAAEEVMGTPELPPSTVGTWFSGSAAAVQRKCKCCGPRSQHLVTDETQIRTPIMKKGIAGQSCESAPEGENEEEKVEVMRHPLSGRVSRAGTDFEARLSETRGEGNSLPDGVRSLMEARFGVDFRAVRLHADSNAGWMTAQLNAAAFTSGHDIYFQPGRYRPDAPTGKELLAHELTHVVQQSTGRVSLQTPSRGLVVGGAPIQCYKLNGFPPPKESRMHSAIASAKTNVAMCDYLTWLGKYDIGRALDNVRYDYEPKLGSCGWTFPSSWYIEVGEDAFDQQKCCYLSSTLAHEAAHVMWRTEGGARKMECECFGCSC